MKKQPLLPYTLKHGLHYVFSNRKTGKVASRNCWLTALAAVAVLNRDNTGLSSLLPQAKAKRLLTSNDLDIRVQRGGGPHRFLSTMLGRQQAKKAAPNLEAAWVLEKKHKTQFQGDFCRWIVKSRQKNGSAYSILETLGFDSIPERASWRWWLDHTK